TTPPSSTRRPIPTARARSSTVALASGGQVLISVWAATLSTSGKSATSAPATRTPSPVWPGPPTAPTTTATTSPAAAPTSTTPTPAIATKAPGAGTTWGTVSSARSLIWATGTAAATNPAHTERMAQKYSIESDARDAFSAVFRAGHAWLIFK